MKYLAFATDYDGTIAHNGHVDEPTLAALERLRASGRKLLLVTGRVLPELRETFPRLDLFERVVENGGLLYTPATGEEQPPAEAPPVEFAARLQKLGVAPLSLGRVIVATWEPFEKTVLQTIHDMGLELQVIFNKGAVMTLPSGVNKASGLAIALKQIGVAPQNCLAIGDAENDHAFLTLCGCAVAVANALPALKDLVDIVTLADHGAGATELIDALLDTDLANVPLRPRLVVPAG